MSKRNKSLVKKASKEVDNTAGWKNIWWILGIIFAVWLALFGFTYMQTNQVFYQQIYIPIMSTNIFSFIGGFAISVLVVAIILKQNQKKGGK